jgi:hypothetical protein
MLMLGGDSQLGVGNLTFLLVSYPTAMKTDSIVGFFFDELDTNDCDPSSFIVKQMGIYELTISRAFVLGTPGSAAGIVIELEPGRFLLIGWGSQVQWKSIHSTSVFTGVLRFLEKTVVDPVTGELRTERKLNGDESRSGCGRTCQMNAQATAIAKFLFPYPRALQLQRSRCISWAEQKFRIE